MEQDIRTNWTRYIFLNLDSNYVQEEDSCLITEAEITSRLDLLNWIKFNQKWLGMSRVGLRHSMLEVVVKIIFQDYIALTIKGEGSQHGLR